MKKLPTKFITAKKGEQKASQPHKSPSNSRKIPEMRLGNWIRLATLQTHWDVLFVSFMCGILLMGISVMGFRLKERFTELQRREEMQAQLEGRKRYWEDIVEKYSDYKDAYYQLAIYSYELGFRAEAQRAIEKVLKIDPNDINGLELAKKISG